LGRERLESRVLFCVEDNLDDGKSISTVSLANQNLTKTAPIRAATQHVNINTDPPSVREINKAISKRKMIRWQEQTASVVICYRQKNL